MHSSLWTKGTLPVAHRAKTVAEHLCIHATQAWPVGQVSASRSQKHARVATHACGWTKPSSGPIASAVLSTPQDYALAGALLIFGEDPGLRCGDGESLR